MQNEALISQTLPSASKHPGVDDYIKIRQRSLDICSYLETEDFVVQPIVDVSPPKWHLAHTTWFFETFILIPFSPGYQVFNDQYNYIFNSYYETVGKRVMRTDRGNLSRPGIRDVFDYRKHVDEAMSGFLKNNLMSDEHSALLALGLQHEEQHQELLYSDIKYILGHNPLFPVYNQSETIDLLTPVDKTFWIDIAEGIYNIGNAGGGFSFDNEHGRHKVFLQGYSIQSELVSSAHFIQFIEDGGYRDFSHWHAEGWDWVKNNQIIAPLYMHKIDGKWHRYTMAGLQEVNPSQPILHLSFYEASAFAHWAGCRLPTEFEWEASAKHFHWGQCWEWTNSAYLPYPGFKTAPGAIGEYNGKFMINQMVLRGASKATAPGHSRMTYRNFFHPHLQWQFSGIRLAK